MDTGLSKMSAFDKIKIIIKNSPQYGHVRVNAQNRETIAVAKVEIEKMLKGI